MHLFCNIIIFNGIFLWNPVLPGVPCPSLHYKYKMELPRKHLLCQEHITKQKEQSHGGWRGGKEKEKKKGKGFRPLSMTPPLEITLSKLHGELEHQN